MAQVSMQTSIAESAEAIWQAISDFNGASRYIAAITNSTMEGTGVGAVRTLTLGDGAQVVERLETLDSDTRTLSYTILSSPLPLANYVATMQVWDLGGGHCALAWSSTFDPQGASEAEAKQIVEGIYNMGFDGLKTLHAGL